MALLVGALAVAHLPLLAQHAAQLWMRPHYRFYPIVLLGAAVLAWLRLRDLKSLTPGRPAVALPLLALAWVALAAAELLASSWGAAVAALSSLAALAYAVGGQALCRCLLGAWLLLWLIVPPPFNLDFELIYWLQDVTTRWSSGVLDLLGIYHLVDGHVVEIDGRRLLVDQACSGINSLFSVLACALFLVFLTRRPPVRSALLLAASLGWVLLANVARVAGVAVLLARWNLDVSSGMRHDAFGLALFAAAIGLIISTDQLLGFLFDPGAAVGGVSTMASSGASSSVVPSGTSRPGDQPASSPRPAGLVWLAALVVPAYLLLLSGHVMAYGLAAGTKGQAAPANLARLDEGALGAQMGPWQRQWAGKVERETGNFHGETSQVWIYRSGAQTATFSLDYPFFEWHDLTRCYVGQGWRLADQGIHQVDGVPGGLVAVRLVKGGGRYGYLLFCELNGRGEPLPARPCGPQLPMVQRQANARSLWARLSGGGGAASAKEGIDPPGPYYQWQMLVESGAPVSPGDEKALRELFAKAFTQVRKQWD